MNKGISRTAYAIVLESRIRRFHAEKSRQPRAIAWVRDPFRWRQSRGAGYDAVHPLRGPSPDLIDA
jgi:hypothetical protein